MNSYQQKITKAEAAGFKFYCDTYSEDGVQGCILTNTEIVSPYNGECIDIFEDGTSTQYCQFKGQQPVFKF